MPRPHRVPAPRAARVGPAEAAEPVAVPVAVLVGTAVRPAEQAAARVAVPGARAERAGTSAAAAPAGRAAPAAETSAAAGQREGQPAAWAAALAAESVPWEEQPEPVAQREGQGASARQAASAGRAARSERPAEAAGPGAPQAATPVELREAAEQRAAVAVALADPREEPAPGREGWVPLSRHGQVAEGQRLRWRIPSYVESSVPHGQISPRSQARSRGSQAAGSRGTSPRTGQPPQRFPARRPADQRL